MAGEMDDDEMVDGGGWISDESDFYGDAHVRRRIRARVGYNVSSSYSSFPIKKVKRPLKSGTSKAPPANLHLGQSKSGSAVDFLRNRSHVTPLQGSGTESSPAKSKAIVEGNAPNLVDNDGYQGWQSAWQHSETISDFVRRAPISDPSTAALGPWLWVGSPKVKSIWKERSARADVNAFEEGGSQLLKAFTIQQDRIKQTIVEAAPAKVARKMGSYRDQLEDDLLALAVETGTTCGKWMLFPLDEDYPRYWRTVAEATAAGRLGPNSKAATYNAIDPVNLICIYTYDFTEREDVVRVLEELINLGLCARDGKPIHYKCDAYTYLGITSSNDYKLRASLYSSKEILGREEKPKKDGPIDRLQKKQSQTIDAFLAA